MKWNLRWAAAKQNIWRPSELLPRFAEYGFTPSLSKVSALWSGVPVTVRLDDLDKMCAALNCTVGDLLEAEPVEQVTPSAEQRQSQQLAVGDDGPGSAGPRPVPRRGTGRPRSLPPN